MIRIVSLVPSLTELLFALDLDQFVVGRTGFCIHPGDKVRGVTKVGGTKTINIERIRELNPTHLIVNREENPRDQVEQIAQFVPNIVVTNPVTVRDNIQLYRHLGEVFEVPENAERLVSQFNRAYRQLQSQQFSRLRVLYLIWRDPWMTISSDTFISHMLSQVAMQTLPDTHALGPLTDGQRYPIVTEQQMTQFAPDLVLLSTEPYRFDESHCELIRGIDGLDATPCRLIDGEMTSWYGPRAIKGLDYLSDFRAAYDAAPTGKRDEQ